MGEQPTERDFLEGLRYEDKFPPGEGERQEVICGVCGAPVNAKARLEAAESALTEALDALEDYGSHVNVVLWQKAQRIRSQIEGSNDG